MPGASEPAVLVASVGVVEDGVVGVSAGGAAFGLGEEVIYNSAMGREVKSLRAKTYGNYIPH